MSHIPGMLMMLDQGGTFDNLKRYFNLLKIHGLAQGYLPDPIKSIMIVHPKNIEAGELFGQCHGFKVCTAAHFIGGYISDD